MKRINFSFVKRQALMTLKGKWLLFSLCLIFSSFVFTTVVPEKYILMYVSNVESFNIFEIIRLFLAMSLGELLLFVLTAAMYRVIFGVSTEKKGIGAVIENANKIFIASLIPAFVTKILFSLLSCLLNPTVLGVLYDYFFISFVDYSIYYFIVVILSFFVSVAQLIVSVVYIFAPCVVADNPLIRGRDALKISRMLIKKRKLNMIFFVLSFAMWYFIGIFAFGIGIFWVRAYVSTAIFIYYKECVNEKMMRFENGSDINV